MESLINHALYEQIKRQTYVTPTSKAGDYMFEMKIKIYSANDEIVETLLHDDLVVCAHVVDRWIYSFRHHELLSIAIDNYLVQEMLEDGFPVLE